VDRIHLSPPDVGNVERDLLLDAFDSGWIAPLGAHVDAFEEELARFVGARHAVALSSGTAALHLALLVAAGVGPGDEVLVPTLTFVATANAVRYLGATPVLVDSEWASWNVDPSLVAAALEERALGGRPLPSAVVAVDLYGQCADYGRLREVCSSFGVALVEDAAEALGATYGESSAGVLGDVGVFSFNGNKIVTTSGGGMLVTNDAAVAARVRHLATQAREPTLHYEHGEVGFNYRLSNLLAAVGRGQLRRLPAMIDRRRAIHRHYADALGNMPGVTFMPEAPYCRSTRWLTVALVDPDALGASRDDLIAALDAADIEARPAWKPMHQQPAFADCALVGEGGVADTIFERGICLPSGSSMTDADVDRVLEALWAVPKR
jgi:dTDP-4-amino-4,6-dideoxygalactose transaminase